MVIETYQYKNLLIWHTNEGYIVEGIGTYPSLKLAKKKINWRTNIKRIF